MYDAARQYRCTIIRGKSQKEMDDLLPAYAKVIDEICPCQEVEFEEMFNSALVHYLPQSQRIKKTLDNHRTEISGKLFGMYFISEDGMVYESDRTKKFLSDNDQPAFFKDICYKMQFPNGMQKTSTVIERMQENISIRPNSFVIKMLQIAETANIEITKKDIGYYILNSLDVLQGKATPYEVLEVISNDKKAHIERLIVVEGKASSYTYQHINEQINYLELANLIRVTSDNVVKLNSHEDNAINLFANTWNEKPEFDVYSFDMSTIEARKEFQYEWDCYFSQLSKEAANFATSATALVEEPEKPLEGGHGINLTEFGDEGEALVFEYEKKRVAAYSQRLANKVIAFGKTKGVGYDIQSVIAEPGDMEEFVKYIEVKSTKRLTCPDVDDSLWIDTLNVTRNEWIAAQQHKEFYSIFRVFFTREGIVIFVLSNIAQKFKEGKMQATPMTYRVDFSNNCIDDVVCLQQE